MNVGDIFWIVAGLSLVQPVIRQQMLEFARRKCLLTLEQKRGSRVIIIVHREESMSILGFPLLRYINIEDSESVLRAVRLTEPEMPVDIILHTPGGVVVAVEQIVRALGRHKGRVTAFVPHYAMSGAALIALAADELVMTENSVLGAVDPQVGDFPAASVLKTIEVKPLDKIEDRTLILAEQARKAVSQMRDLVVEIVGMRIEKADAVRVAEELTSGTWTMDYPITVDELREMGLAVNTEMPAEVFQLMSLYPQGSNGRPSVDFIPMRYQTPGAGTGGVE